MLPATAASPSEAFLQRSRVQPCSNRDPRSANASDDATLATRTHMQSGKEENARCPRRSLKGERSGSTLPPQKRAQKSLESLESRLHILE
ncbi:hypothetical protein LZ31DRAFT_548477 [Colletotrichum somersetense]|nr:hypothetical protein LZ31DRAFT_548477 [Colletotrichum somersetense]